MSTTCVQAAQPSGRVIRTWTIPPGGVCEADSTPREMEILFKNLPEAISEHLRCHFKHRLKNLCELYIQIGQIPECIFADPYTGATTRQDIANEPCTEHHVNMFSQFFGANAETNMTTTKRKGIPGTLHRVSLITHPMRNPQKVLGVAVRVGRSMQGLVETMAWKSFLLDLARQKHSLVLIGKPGVGKTTCLREIARILAEDRSLNVVVVDKTCEIAGDDDAPHSAIGRARWMPVGKPNMQHHIMREAVENQSPDVIIVDEISTPQEVEAARTIAQRGVQLIATVHGLTLPEVIMCKERGNLMGGIASVTLSGSEAERRFDKRKQVQKRAREPIFSAALELHSRSKWILHPSVKDAADAYLEGEPCDAQELSAGKAVAVAAIPGEGMFEYCIECGRGATCSQHKAGHIDTATTRQSYSSSVNVTTTAKSSLSENRNATNVVHDTFKSLSLSQRSQSKKQTFSYSSGKGRPARKWRAPRGSGRCYRCNETGHYARDCCNE